MRCNGLESSRLLFGTSATTPAEDVLQLKTLGGSLQGFKGGT